MRETGLAELEAAGAEAVGAHVVPRSRRGDPRARAPARRTPNISGDDLRVLRTLADQSAVALENARAYHALEAALRRVQILESIRANLAKFVPRAVQDLIERDAGGAGARQARRRRVRCSSSTSWAIAG